MKPWNVVERVLAPDGTEMTLVQRDGEYVVRYAGKVLMSTRQHASEEALATLAFELIDDSKGDKKAEPKTVLVGGMGLGYTARAALDRLSRGGKVLIAEFTPEIVHWNEKHVGAFARHPLADPRVRVQLGDAVALIYSSTNLYDLILLDIDNGPSGMVHAANQRLYGDRGIAACHRALKPGGVLAVWSSDPDSPYLKRLERGGFAASSKNIAARGDSGGVRHVIFLGLRREPSKNQLAKATVDNPLGAPRGRQKPRPPRGSVRTRR